MQHMSRRRLTSARFGDVNVRCEVEFASKYSAGTASLNLEPPSRRVMPLRRVVRLPSPLSIRDGVGIQAVLRADNSVACLRQAVPVHHLAEDDCLRRKQLASCCYQQQGLVGAQTRAILLMISTEWVMQQGLRRSYITLLSFNLGLLL